MLVFVDGKAKGDNPAIVKGPPGVGVEPLFGFQREIIGVVLGKAFQYALHEAAFRCVRQPLGGIQDLDATAGQLLFIDGGLVLVPAKAVHLVDDDVVDAAFGDDIIDHLLKAGAIGREPGSGLVRVVVHDGDALRLGVLFDVIELSLDGFLSLIVGRVARVNYSSFHIKKPPFCLCKAGLVWYTKGVLISMPFLRPAILSSPTVLVHGGGIFFYLILFVI